MNNAGWGSVPAARRSGFTMREEDTMSPYRRAGRWALVAVAVLVAGWVLLRVGAGMYLRTSAGRATVANQLQGMIGLPVEVTEVDLGSRTSSIKFRVLEPSAGTRPPVEVLSVESATADVSFADVLTRSVSPKELTLRGATLNLRLAADGKVLTTLPQAAAGAGRGPVPRVTVENARVHVQQDGQPDFDLTGVSAVAEPKGDRLTITGTIDDPKWAKWTIGGDVDTATKTGWVELNTPDGPLQVELLKSLPYVPPSTWDDLRPTGRATGKFRLTVGADQKIDYVVDVGPKQATLTIPVADATLTDVVGLISFRNGKLGLTDCAGRFAGGAITAAGDWDFNPPQPGGEKLASAARVTVTADALDMAHVPASWGLNKDLGGQLTGKATIRAKVYADGRVDPEGTTGDGVLTGASLRGLDVDDIPIHVGREGRRLRLRQGKPPAEAPKTGSRAEPANPWRTAANEEPNPPTPVPKKEGGAGSAGSVGGGVFALLALQPPAKKADDESTTVDATIRLRDIEIAQLLDKLDVKLPYQLAGRVTVEVKVAVPLAAASSRAAYRFTGTVSSKEFRVEGLTLRDLSAAVDYQNGKLTLTALKGTVPHAGGAGSFVGTAAVAVEPPGDASANLTLDRIPVAEVARALPGFTMQLGGLVSGKATFRAPYDKLDDPTTWAATAEVASDELTVAGRTAKDVKLAAVVEKGTARLKDATATVEGIPVSAGATLSITGAMKYEATVRTTPVSVADLRRLIPEANLAVPVEGLLETEAKAAGTLSPFTTAASGSLRATKLAIGKTAANHIALRWAFDNNRVTVTDLKAELFNGTLAGSADVPLDPRQAGTFGVEFKELDAAAAVALVRDFPVRITGRISGKVTGGLPPTKPGEPRTATADVDLTAPRLTVQGIPAERLTGKFGVAEGTFRYELEGRTLGGSFEVKGRYPGPKKPAGEAPPAKDDRGHLHIEGLDLSRLADLGFGSLRHLAGRVDLTLNYANDLSEGSGRVSVRGLAWGKDAFSRDLTGAVVMRHGTVEIQDLGGRFAGGSVRLRGRVNARDPDRNFFVVAVERANPKRLFAPLPDLADVMTGEVTLEIRGRFGREVRGTGSLTLLRGSIAGIAAHELRVPFDFATAPGGYGRFTVRDIAAQAGGGAVQGGVTYEWGGEGRLSGRITFSNLRLQSLSPGLGESGLFGNGRVNGRLDLSGTNVRSINDVSGSLVATFNQTSVREIPLLNSITPFLSTNVLLLQPFQSGDIQGRLGGGIFRVNRLALSSPTSQLFAEGTITLAGRRLDLNVVAHTGQIGPQVRGLRLLGLRLPAFGPIPITLIRDVSDFLSNRTIRLTVGGTLDAPSVRVNTAALLGDEAVRFFLSRYVLPADAAGVLGVGSGVGGLVGGTTSGSMNR